jgi:hypothetical protein
MKTWTLILALSLSAVAQDAPRPEGLVLESHDVDVEFHENLGFMTVAFKVKNPTDRPLEGEVAFLAPSRAAVYEMSILKHIGSTQRRAVLLRPNHAVALYVGDKERQLNGQSPADATGGLAAIRSGQRMPDALHAGEGGNPASNFIANAMARHRAGFDPALLELRGEDRYHLRFFPVPARDNQTVTFRIAFEVPRQGKRYEATVPLRLDSNFSTARARFTGTVAVSSSDVLGLPSSSSHDLRRVQRSEDQRRVMAAMDPQDGKSLVLSYDLGFWAKLHDPAAGAKSAEGLGAAGTSALRALRSLRALEAADEISRRELGPAAGAVSAWGSFLAIEKGDARDLAREAERALRPDPAPAAPMTDEEAKECEFVRAAKKLPARSWAPRCEIHVVSTNDPAKLQWARDNGIGSGRSTGLLNGTSFEYVKHGTGCPVQEPNVEKLRQRAAALK